MQDVLQVQRQQEELRERDRADDRHRGVRDRERPRAEDPQREERVRSPQLDGDEREDERDGTCEQPDGRRRSPTVARRPRHRIHEQHQPGRDRGRAGEVEMTVREIRTALAEQHGRDRDRGNADRDVDEEDPRPVQIRRENAAEENARGGAASGRCAVDAEGEVPLPADVDAIWVTPLLGLDYVRDGLIDKH